MTMIWLKIKVWVIIDMDGHPNGIKRSWIVSRKAMEMCVRIITQLQLQTNFQIEQTFISKNELKTLVDQVLMRNSFDYATLKNCSKWFKVKCISPDCAWMLQERKYECSIIFFIYKYVGYHICDVEHITHNHKEISIKFIMSHSVKYVSKWQGITHQRNSENYFQRTCL